MSPFKRIPTLLFLIGFVSILGLVFSLPETRTKVSAGTTQNLSGWAWTSNVGWIAFNCNTPGTGQDTPPLGVTCDTGPDYGVNVETSGELTGYAWSNNFGWVSFNRADSTGCPIPDPEVDFNGGCGAKLLSVANGHRRLVGWARALSGANDPDDGWTGFISFNPKPGVEATSMPTVVGANCTRIPPDNGCYGVRMNSTSLRFSGFAWGGEVLGWISFAPVVAGLPIPETVKFKTPGPAFTLALNAVPPTLPAGGGSSVLSWGTMDATACTFTSTDSLGASNPTWNALASTLTTGTQAIPIVNTTTFSISCSGPGGADISDSVTVDVGAAASANFTLTATPQEFNINFTSDKAEVVSVPVTVRVVPGVGFAAPVTLSVNSASWPINALNTQEKTGPTARFGQRGAISAVSSTLSNAAQYTAGVPLYIAIPRAVKEGVYDVVITGRAGVVTKTITVPIRIKSFTPEPVEE